MTDPRTDTTAPGQSGSRPTRQLTRSSHDRMLAGVAGGIARYTDSPPALWRVLFVITAFAGGLGIVAYGAAWLLLPEDADPSAKRAATGRDVGTWVGIALLALAALIVVDRVSIFHGGLVIPAVLVLAGVLIWQSGQRDHHEAPPGSTPPTAPPPPPAATPAPPAPASPDAADRAATAGIPPDTATTARLDQSETDMSTTQQLPPAPPTASVPPSGWSPPPSRPGADDRPQWTPPPADERPRSGLGRIVVALILVMIGSAAILDNLAVVDVSIATVSAIALLMVGLGLVVGAWWGRARGLIVLGALLIPLVAVSGLANLDRAPLAGGVGDRRFEPVAVADLQGSYRLAAGQLTLDLTDVDFTDHTVDVDASVAFGELDVRVPQGVRVEVDGQVGIGDLQLFDVEDSGIGLDRTVADEGREGAGTLRLHLNSGFGQIQVRRAGEGLFGLPAPQVGPTAGSVLVPAPEVR